MGGLDVSSWPKSFAAESICAFAYIRVLVCVCTRVSVCVCVCVCACVCVCVYSAGKIMSVNLTAACHGCL